MKLQKGPLLYLEAFLIPEISNIRVLSSLMQQVICFWLNPFY